MNIMYVGDAKRDIEAGRLANMKTISAEYGYIKDEDDPKSWDADISASSPIALNKIIKKGLL